MDIEDKVRENRLRRMATRQQLKLVKSRRRDERAYDFGVYWISDLNNNLQSPEAGMNIDEVEEFLTS